MSNPRIAGYTYKAETLCSSCAATAVGWDGISNPHAHIDKAGRAKGIDVGDERSFDSGDWPKTIFETQIEGPEEKCDSCGVSLVA